MKIIFGSFDLENGLRLHVPGQWQCAQIVGIKQNVNYNNCNCFANKVHIEMFIKLIIFLVCEFYIYSIIIYANLKQCLFYIYAQ